MMIEQLTIVSETTVDADTDFDKCETTFDNDTYSDEDDTSYDDYKTTFDETLLSMMIEQLSILFLKTFSADYTMIKSTKD